MIPLIAAFSVRAAPVFQRERKDEIIESFAVRSQMLHEQSRNSIIAERFNAGLQLTHVPEGSPEAFRTFGIVPGAYDVLGKEMPEHTSEITDIVRYHANG